MKTLLTQKKFRTRYSFILLLSSLIFLLIFPPYWQGEYKRLISNILLSVTMFSFLLLVIEKKWELTAAIALSIPAIFHNWSGFIYTGNYQSTTLITLNVLFYLFITFELLRYVMNEKVVDFNIISASISAYLLLGVVWAYIYTVIDLNSPGSIFESFSYTDSDTFLKYLYFSYVTMTTLGYGDISPHTTIAQNWVILQAIIGQFYLAIIVARLVAIYSSQGSHSERYDE
ncbi:potassium channel family protein [Amphritea sp. HPY]|uniref:potassium channel family protein n=1 Tax=Amphritea sp. HPY TaxID=3421652 RepID=UPI003D7C53BA